MKDDKRTLTPTIRFPEFDGAPGWRATLLRSIATPVTERANTEDASDVLTLSAEHGVVLQSDYFGKRVAGRDSGRYIKIAHNDFVYNDRTTQRSVYGTIKRLSEYEGGIVSPIYKCFRFNAGENPNFWDWYFASGMHDTALGGLVNEGARAGRFNISPERFLSTTVWHPSDLEQRKIAECLTSLDHSIAAEGRKLETLQVHKEGLMQQLFPREGEALPRLRFPEFHNEAPWTERLLGNEGRFLSSLTGKVGADFDRGEAKFIPYTNVFANTFTDVHDLRAVDVSEDEPQNPVKQGDVFFTVSSETAPDAGMASVLLQPIERCYLNSFCALFRFDEDKRPNINLVFLGYLLRTPSSRAHISRGAQGAIRYNISKGIFRSLPLPFPSPAEQQQVAACLSSLDALVVAQSGKLDRLRAHKKGLMQQLFPSPVPERV